MRYRALPITCLSAGLIVLGAVPAHADGYRYWTYWTTDAGAWQYSQFGPAGVAVADGDVHGWRFAISTDDGSMAPEPRVAADFDAVCANTMAADGEIRVALIIDPGSADDAPDGENPNDLTSHCAVVPSGSTGATVLSAIAPLRLADGFVCAIDGYPARECAAAVEATSDSPGESPIEATGNAAVVSAMDGQPGDASSPSNGQVAQNITPFIIGAAAVILGLAIAWFMHRRRT